MSSRILATAEMLEAKITVAIAGKVPSEGMPEIAGMLA
jgi:hypothetical protein